MEVTMNISKTLNANATITVDGMTVAYLNASVSTEGSNDNISQSIQDKTLYQSNRDAVREQIARFQEEVYRLQDAQQTQV